MRRERRKPSSLIFKEIASDCGVSTDNSTADAARRNFILSLCYGCIMKGGKNRGDKKERRNV